MTRDDGRPGGKAAPAGDGLGAFSPATRAWFTAAFAAPTPAQLGAWEAIGAGDHALVIAPTGSGKTLAAFLWGLDRLLTAGATVPEQRCRILYVSPLKALAADVERNLRSPLVGISQAAAGAGIDLADVTVGMRTGDTTPSERRRLVAHPPDIFITTPESLYLVLTSAARESLRGVEAVILDEIHVLAGSKRGAHLALSLERLDAMLERPVQRIGLSATVTPPERVARFLTGTRPLDDGGRAVRIVHPQATTRMRINVAVPVPDLTELPQEAAAGTGDLLRASQSTPFDIGEPPPETAGAAPTGSPPADVVAPADTPPGEAISAGAPAGPSDTFAPPVSGTASVWPHVTERIVDLITAHRSTIVFTNSRRGAERLAARINEAWSSRLGDAPSLGAGQAAQMPGQSGTSWAATAEIARAHHGSMSRERRTEIETALKSGQLPAVVATSSLELGIDMGSVDLVIQVGAPPSVAATLQRVGRAGHQVGATSSGIVIPTHRGELLPAAVITSRAAAGQIEDVAELRNPLDVLAQQIVAMLAVEELALSDLVRLVRRSAPFAELGDGALHAVLDMLSGRYPSEDFAELRPRIVWDRPGGVLRGRPGALRLATTSGGTIPDRGLYGVYLATDGAGTRAASATGADTGGRTTANGTAAVTARGRGGRRVGELDEEMVFESRVGDVFTLGSSTWRIEEITPDRVLVSPAPGQVGRLPFWRGDGPRRPAELGRAIGELQRHLTSASPERVQEMLRDAGLDEWASDNLLDHLAAQREEAGQVSDDRTIVLERFRDELGDWRLVLHSPFGGKVHAPWAAVLTARLRERLGMDVAAMAADDGIVLRLPDVVGPSDAAGGGGDIPITAADLLIDPVDVSDAVVAALAGSAHFAARFREAAARSLLLPRRRPDRRQPLWQQRQRASQLLAVAADHPDFPVVLEAVRECLQDDFDTPALTDLMSGIASREVRLVEVTTPSPSPFARSLLFGYVGQFLYDGDAPLAEQRLTALTLDHRLLAELIGESVLDLSDILDPVAVAEVSAEVGLRTHPATDAEGVWDLVRRLGPVATPQIAQRVATDEPASEQAAPDHAAPDQEGSGQAADPTPDPAGTATRWLDELAAQRRIIEVRVAGRPRWADLSDAARLRDGLGVALPPGIPEELLAPVSDPLGDLVRRFARTHGPFTREDLAAFLGLGTGALADVVQRLIDTGVLVSARFTVPSARSEAPQQADHTPVPGSPPESASARESAEPAAATTATGGQIIAELCDAEVLRRIRRRSLARLRSEVEAAAPEQLAAFLPRWQQIGTEPRSSPDLAGVVDQLAGARIPASAMESLVLPARMPRFTSTELDDLLSAGDLLWCGAGSLPGVDGYLALVPADSPELLPAPGEHPGSTLHEALLGALEAGGGHFFRDLLSACADHAQDTRALGEALWDLVWAGRVTNDTLAPVRARLTDGRPAHHTPRRAPRARQALSRRRMLAVPRTPGAGAVPPHLGGRWSLVRRPETTAEARLLATCAALLERHGVLTRAAAGIDEIPGGFGALYPVLARLEESGAVRRGYFVEGLGAAQFALPECVDLLRRTDLPRRTESGPIGHGHTGYGHTGYGHTDAGPTGSGISPDHPGSRRTGAPPRIDLLAATDPANPYGAALPWPQGPGRPRRAAGAVVVLADGVLVLFVERGGRSLLSFTDEDDLRAATARRLAEAVGEQRLGRVIIERIDSESALTSHGAMAEALREAGFLVTPRGLRLRENRTGAARARG